MTTGDVIVRVYGISDVGRAREHNEDAFAVADLATGNLVDFPTERTERPGGRGALFMVADGMGGAASGELASSMAVDVIVQELRHRWTAANGDPTAFAAALHASTAVANDRIHRYATDHPENRGMGTTATVAGVLGDELFIAQVGDSRAYLIRKGEARQITKDQSLMQRLIEAGEMTEAEAEVSERRNIILQALGPEPTIKIDVTRQQLRRGDILVLCSDGLSGQVRDSEIAEVARQSPDVESLAQQLIDRANDTGGPDNITVVVAQFDGEGLAEPTPLDTVGHQSFPVEGEEDTPIAIPQFMLRDGALGDTSRSTSLGDGALRNASSPDTSPRSGDGAAPRPAARIEHAPRRISTDDRLRAIASLSSPANPGPPRWLGPLIGAALALAALLGALYFRHHYR
jgi:serine/threonine protein phosphatase PrpC